MCQICLITSRLTPVGAIMIVFDKVFGQNLSCWIKMGMIHATISQEIEQYINTLWMRSA
jgi:hypothetical protein